MTETIDTAQPEALRLAAWLNEGAWHQMRLGDVEAAGRELRRLHSALAAAEARNATLTREAHENKYRAREFERQAERYRELRRGQDWSVIDGIGDTLRAEALDEAIDAAIQARAAAMKEKTP